MVKKILLDKKISLSAYLPVKYCLRPVVVHKVQGSSFEVSELSAAGKIISKSVISQSPEI